MLNKIIQSILRIWNDATPAARIGLILLTSLCLLILSLVGYWSSQPSFVTLVSDSDTARISRVVDELERKGIKYELGGAGGVLRVDKRNLAKARIVASHAGVSSDDSQSMTGAGGMWLDPTDRKNLEISKKESGLKASIKKYASIINADVHLNVPAKGPFERKLAKPTASVLLELVPGHFLSEENVLAIASTVAYAVEDLQPEMVRITDKAGNVYLVPNESTGNVNRQIDFTTQLERKLASNAERLLSRSFGPGNATVQVSLDMTFKQVEVSTTDYDSERKVVKQEELTTQSTTKESQDAPGVAGVQSNLNAPTTGQTGIQDRSEQSTNSYLVPETQQREINNTPIRNFMSVSVLVNQSAPGVSQEDGSLRPDIGNRVEQLVKMAVGFKEDVDQIFVDFAPFSDASLDELAAVPMDWTPIQELLQTVSLAIAAIVALIIVCLILRHLRNTASTATAVTAIGQPATNLNHLNDLAQSHPEVFARILKAWAGSNSDSRASKSNAKPNAA